MSSTFLTVAKKEWRDSVRDRRSIGAAVLFAIAGPALIAVMIAVRAEDETSDEPLEVQVAGAEHAPDLAVYLRRHDVEFSVPNGSDPNGSAGVHLWIPGDYAERFRGGRQVTITLAADRSRPADQRAVLRLHRLLQAYSVELGQARLALRGVAPVVARPLAVDARDLATPEARASTLLGFLSIYFLLAPFIGAMAVSIDVSAGERERNSLEVLMAQPVSPTAVFAGKTAVASLFGALGVALTIAVSKLAFLGVPLADLGLAWTLTWWDAGRILSSLVPLAVLVAALQILLSMWAKTFKEASAYLNMLSFVPMAVALGVMIKEVDAEPWMYAVPLLGHQHLIRTMIRAEPVDPALAALLAVSTLALAALLVAAGGFLLTRERIIFGQSD